MASSSLDSASQFGDCCKTGINWPLLHFPPINLWVMPTWSSALHSIAAVSTTKTPPANNRQEKHHA
ncbi:MAG: hypothetical protein Q9M25_09415 [Mariprofundaceae bacterium]|nr:hypothetical protein [Mariprofundaceae bacterium]